ncbi:lipid-binding protein [Sphingobacterium sp. Lzh-3]|uniref:lipid-binding protein n=1 Tax=Sphingobacterium sp. Lzh-3 TaxID=3382150 RepID=UPI00398CD7AC
MKHIFKYFLGFLVLGFVACKQDQPAVEYSPIFPISGEWHTHVFNEDGSSASASLFALSTYNTSDNLSNVAWFKLSNVAQPFGVLAKVNVDVPNKTFVAGQYINTLPVPANSTAITLIEGKIMLNASTQPSKAVADSIYVKYKTGVNGKTYIVKGHRRTQWPEDQK